MSGIFRTKSSSVKSSNKVKDERGRTRSLSFPFRRRNSKALAEPIDTTLYRVFVKIDLIGDGSGRRTTSLNGVTHLERIVPSVDGKINLSDIVDVEMADVASRNSTVRHNKDWETLCSKYIPLVHFGFADMTFHRRDDGQSPSSEVWKDHRTRQSFQMDWDSYQSRSVTTTPTQELKAFLDYRIDAANATRDAEQAEWNGSKPFSSSDHTSAVDVLTHKRVSSTQPIWSDVKKTLARSVSITALSADHQETSQDVAEVGRGFGKITVVYSQQWGRVDPTILHDDGSAR